MMEWNCVTLMRNWVESKKNEGGLKSVGNFVFVIRSLMFICVSPLPSSLESIRIFLRGREKEKKNTGKSIDPIDQITKDCTIGRGNRGRERRGVGCGL